MSLFKVDPKIEAEWKSLAALIEYPVGLHNFLFILRVYLETIFGEEAKREFLIVFEKEKINI